MCVEKAILIVLVRAVVEDDFEEDIVMANILYGGLYFDHTALK